MSKKLVLIDGHSILNRAFYGLPDLTNSQGLHTNAVYGFLNIMFRILEEEKPDYLAVAFDVHAKTFRHEMYEAYKGTRKGMPEELREQVPLMKEVLQSMNVIIMEQAGLEADDILGTLAKKAEREDIDVSLISGDRDLLQIASERIKIRIPKTKMGKTEIEDYYAADVKQAYHVTPLQFIELKALMGDTADNIPGVPKIGNKTATELMVQFGSIENIYAHVEEISKKSVRETLQANRDMANLSLALATIKTDCDLELDYEKAKADGYFTKEAYALFKKLEFKNLLSRFETKENDQNWDNLIKSFIQIKNCKELVTCIQNIDINSTIAVLPVYEGREFVGIALSLSEDETLFYMLPKPLFGFEQEKEMIINEISLLSSRMRGVLATFDIKPQYSYLSYDNVNHYFDVLIASYLLNPLKSDYDLEAVANEQLGIMIPGKAEVFGKKTPNELYDAAPKQVMEFYCIGAYVIRKSVEILRNKLNETGMYSLFMDIEMPLSLVLYDMEKEGIMVKREELKTYGEALTDRILELEAKIHQEAGISFNILSPKQLGEVLFDKLQLPGGKKTKTGYSTAADVLDKLAGEHKIVRDVLEYRGLTKLKSTYAEGLVNYIGEDERIHTNFNQTITATGRISSTEPNLQNIPMKMELGRRIRKVFVPAENCVFLDADYSQIELRILAHMSGDQQLIEAYRTKQDIHRITASKVFHTPFKEVTDLQRRNAKAVNFGIVYGISSFGLSQDLSITPKEAAHYIEEYFATYPKVKAFLDETVAKTKELGYSTTLFGRRRPVPELASSNFMQRSFGERVAMNSPIQGTAADIIKIAMLKVWKALREAGLQSKLILQIHDELLIETRVDEEETVRRIMEEKMTEAAKLAVTLEVDVHSGKNWFEAK